MAGKRWTPRVVRYQACQRVLAGELLRVVSAEHGVRRSTLHYWMRDYGYRFDRAAGRWVRRD